MDRTAIKESRRVLRFVEEHLAQSHLNLGVKQESVGLVDVVHHPSNKLSHLNYVSPRRKTAWIPGPEIEKGLEQLRRLKRVPRVYYIEGLYPPLFAKSLRDLGLVVEDEIPLMAYKVEDHPEGTSFGMLSGMNTEIAEDQDGVAMWWYVWRNAYYDVITGGTEPVYIGQDMRQITLGRQVDVLVYRYSFPVGVIRLTIHEKTAHINAIAIMKEERTAQVIKVIHQAALKTAVDRGGTLVFTTGDSDKNRNICREIGFVDFGSIVCYAEPSENLSEGTDDKALAEPVFVLR